MYRVKNITTRASCLGLCDLPFWHDNREHEGPATETRRV